MSADLTNPFGPSCCDGGECSVSHESAQPCGCDRGANHLCDEHGMERNAFIAGYNTAYFDTHDKYDSPESAYDSWKRSTCLRKAGS